MVYITKFYDSHDNAVAINSLRRIKTIKKLGYQVYIYKHSGKFLYNILSLYPHIKHSQGIIIRIDGSCILDKYSLLKIIFPNKQFIWEVHGFPEENITENSNYSSRVQVNWKNIKRKIYSFFINLDIFISEELEIYSKNKIFIHKKIVIQNYYNAIISNRKSTNPLLSLILNKWKFLVLWGGSAQYPWHALDVIEQVAKKIYAKDPKIIFIILGGTESWHRFNWFKNIILVSKMPLSDYLNFVKKSNICLALYNIKSMKFYMSPLKLLDYMALGKPVITTGIGSIKSLIRNGINGMLTDNNIDNIVEKILLLKNNPKIAKSLGKNAQITIKHNYNEDKAKRLYQIAFRSVGIN
ncbi:MAG: hypothetical protein A2V66_11435 [Ignavibacteria bacterium RBG_13_36_8]|nr:MAG: hypothetical protein A2V66_11435 [Ignavibacteria bacterium RBG_13_36_8]